ncbi:long-chain-fatty-acid--CoA ligase [Oceanobacillus sp. CF4.6]|uniref:long-chain-fatty-acid--CoA ligase n=1 Tax=Oceanobacillus sp. CF4.6 TaxID=3373080 RepID=UPI003EE52B7D
MNTAHYQFWPERLPKTLIIPDTTLVDNLEATMTKYPNNIAFHFYGEKYTYRQVYNEVINLAGYLQNVLHVEKGEKVLLFMQNSPQYIISFYAILRVEAIIVPINPMSTREDLEFFVKDCNIRQAIVGQELYEKVSPLKQTTSLKNIIIASYSDYINKDLALGVIPNIVLEEPIKVNEAIHWKETVAKNEKPSTYNGANKDIALIPYTSGTTGLPKGCLHTHATIQTNTHSSYHWFNKNSDSVALASLPMFHVSGLIHSMLAINLAGGTMIILTRWDRDYAAKAIEKFQITHWFNISTMLIDFLSNSKLNKFNISSLQMIGGGGAPLPAVVGEELYDLTGLRYIEAYGLTETISQTHLNPTQRPKLQCLGIPSFGVDARVIDPITEEEKGDDEEGELIVHGDQIFKGYYNRVEENEDAFIEVDGRKFFRTGDIVIRDKEGYYFMVDRLKRMINASGFKVWPTEIESKLYKHPAVQQACVVGVPDKKRGETVKAFVIVNNEYIGKIKEEEIMDWARENMAAYKYPRIVEFRDSLPTTSSGKILWKQLQEESPIL